MKDLKNKKCFIVNRGEVLKRISSTLKRLDIKSVSISDGSSFIRENVDILLEENSDISSYLNRQKLIDLALKNKVDMIHPGYGFLSEDYEFASLVENSKIVWIGPSSSTIEKLSNKYSSKKIAHSLGIPTTKSSNLIDSATSIDDIKSLLKDFRYPLIIKNVFSGGGKGIRIVKDPKDLETLINQSYKEGSRYFSSSSIIIEEYLENVSHVEVQIISDKYGNAFVLGTRECSIQRKNQKILEEAPSYISEKVFERLKEYSLKIIKHCSYDSLGTVEFLVDKNKEDIYFLEVNTRLQVEHGVTEKIYDLDLVELQIKIAYDFNIKDDPGLFNKLKDIDSTNKACKHSIEIRLCSEEPFSFLPSSGRKKIVPVYYKDHIRWDTGVDFCKDIDVDEGFDSLLTKIIVTASSRDEVIDIFNKKLFSEIKIDGVTNLDLFKSIFKEKDFINNVITTRYLNNHIDQLKELNLDNISSTDLSYIPSLEEITRFAFSKNDIFKYTKSTQTYNNLNSTSMRIKDIEKISTNNSSCINKDLNIKKTNDISLDKNFGLNSIYPPVPGKILSLNIKEGSLVKKNDIICTIESMKMEIEVVSEYSGKVESITDNSWVNTSDVIVTLSSNANLNDSI